MIIKPIGTTQVLTASGSSAQSSAIDANLVRIASTTAIHIVTGSNPTATTSGMVITPNQAEYLRVVPGEKIAVIQVSAGGSVSITPVK